MKLPDFDSLLEQYPCGGVVDVKKLVGGAVDDTLQPQGKQWLGGVNGNTCTIRMSRAPNYSGVHIPAKYSGLRTAPGRDRLHYAFAVQEIRLWLTATFGPPNIDTRGKPYRGSLSQKQKALCCSTLTLG